MKIKFLSIAALVIMFVACGPSAADQEAHEVDRERAEKKLEENWEDDLGDMMEEVNEIVEEATDEVEKAVDPSSSTESH